MNNQRINESQNKIKKKHTKYSKAFWTSFIGWVVMDTFIIDRGLLIGLIAMNPFLIGTSLFFSIVSGLIFSKAGIFVMTQFVGPNVGEYRLDTNFNTGLSKEVFLNKLRNFVEAHKGTMREDADDVLIKFGKRFTFRNWHLGYNKIALLDELLVPCVIQMRLAETPAGIEVKLSYIDNLSPIYEHPELYELAFINYFKRIDRMIVEQVVM